MNRDDLKKASTATSRPEYKYRTCATHKPRRYKYVSEANREAHRINVRAHTLDNKRRTWGSAERSRTHTHMAN